MATQKRIDPEIQIRQDFEREDREDSRSLRWSLLGALVVHALLLTLALPAAEQDGEWQVTACVISSKETYARPPVRRTVSNFVPKPVATNVCNLTPPQQIDLEPLLGVDLELDMEPAPRRESPPWSRSLGITPTLIACVEPQWTEAARRVRIQGSVIVEITIREDGTVADPKIVKRLPFGLAESAVEAVVGWRYEPIQVDGRPAALRHVVVVGFKLGETNCPSAPSAAP